MTTPWCELSLSTRLCLRRHRLSPSPQSSGSKPGSASGSWSRSYWQEFAAPGLPLSPVGESPDAEHQLALSVMSSEVSISSAETPSPKPKALV